ncbi:MAG: sporulation protein YqfD [Clostridia bacterium]|nr:sporulation protein YqfD [Clostridia bacterium]
MINKLVSFFRGKVTLRIPREDAAAFTDLLLSAKIPAKLRSAEDDGGILAEMSPGFVKKISYSLDNLHLKVYIIDVEGFFSVLMRMRYRIGAVIGAALFFVLIWLSSLYVWRVEVIGADKIPREELVSALSQLGVGEGSRISEIDAFKVGNSLLMAYPALSWTSLDITGTTVTLTVRETVKEQLEEENRTSLIVASEDGIIQSVLVYSGVAAVKPGSVVKAGDVLINGLISGSGLQYSPEPILRVGMASGSVTASVERSLAVAVPLEETVQADSGGKPLVRRELTVFGRKLYFGDRPPEGNFSCSERSYRVTLFGAVRLPVTVRETVWTPQTEVVFRRTGAEAEALARQLAEESVRDGVGSGKLTHAEYRVSADGSGCTVNVSYGCIVEITLPVSIGNASGNE